MNMSRLFSYLRYLALAAFIIAAGLGLLIILIILPFFGGLVDREFTASDIMNGQVLAPFFLGSVLFCRFFYIRRCAVRRGRDLERSIGDLYG